MPHLSHIRGPKKIRPIIAYGQLLWTRANQDRLSVVAGNLAYISLLSLVPLITVVFALFAAFPMFSEVSVQLKSFVFTNFVPAASETIQQYLERFVENSNKMTAIGTCGLIVTALLLISSVDSALNAIWRSERQRPIVFSFAVYWMVLTLGPLLAGASMASSSYLLSLGWLDVSEFSNMTDRLLQVFPLLLSFVSFWLIYSIVPTVSVPAKDAAIGAIVGAVLFELSKKVFALYVTLFPSYQLIYGVLAVIPILFVWVYLSWCIVLFGAEVTVTLSDYRKLREDYDTDTSLDSGIEK